MTTSEQGPWNWTSADMPTQGRRTVVVTGASSGLGAVATAELARAGAHVVMGVRDVAKGERVRATLEPDVADRVEVRRLELGDLTSVAEFAHGVRTDHPVLDLLMCVAGTGRAATPHSAEGFQSVFATNHLAHFALTGELLGALSRARNARVVSVGSNVYRRVAVDLPLDDLGASASAAKEYVAAKLAVLMFALEFDRRLRAAGSPVRSLAAHPGVADTPMNRQAGGSLLEKSLGRLLRVVLGRSAEAGTIPLLFAATAPPAPTGVLLGPSLRKHDLKVYAQPIVGPADDRVLAARLWEVSERATGVDFGLPPA